MDKVEKGEKRRIFLGVERAAVEERQHRLLLPKRVKESLGEEVVLIVGKFFGERALLIYPKESEAILKVLKGGWKEGEKPYLALLLRSYSRRVDSSGRISLPREIGDSFKGEVVLVGELDRWVLLTSESYEKLNGEVLEDESYLLEQLEAGLRSLLTGEV